MQVTNSPREGTQRVPHGKETADKFVHLPIQFPEYLPTVGDPGTEAPAFTF